MAKLLSAVVNGHFQGDKRLRKLLIFNDLSKKSNDRIVVCILIKTINLYELILAVVPLFYEFYSFYSANSAHRDSLSAHIGHHFGFCLHFGALYLWERPRNQQRI